MKKNDVLKKAEAARAAGLKMAAVSGKTRREALKAMAAALIENADAIVRENKKDLEAGIKKGLSGALLDRLTLDPVRVKKMARALKVVAALKDPVGKVDLKTRRPPGFTLKKVRVPIGVVAVIYESRPNVTADTAGLCLKSGNAVILKGGSESLNSNTVIVNVLIKSAEKAGIPKGAIQFINTSDRAAVTELLKLDEFVDVVIPRGGEALIRAVAEQARMPVIKHYKGVCHIYVDDKADRAMAKKVVINAKVQRPGVCNAMETLLLNRKLPKTCLSDILSGLGDAGVDIRGGQDVKAVYPKAKAVKASDWNAEYLELILSVKLVGNMDEAIDHINTYGSKHTDAVITRDKKRAARFVTMVDSSSVMVNATTRLADGGVYGLGAEVGISTDKIGGRGPMGIEDLTTYKWVVTGNGTIRE